MSLVRYIHGILVRRWLWFTEHAQRPWMLGGLASLAWMETVFLPMPIDLMLIAMVVADTRRWRHLAFITTIASIVGAVVGYGIGAYVFDMIGRPFLALRGLDLGFVAFREVFNQSGFWVVSAAALSLAPSGVIMAGLFGMNFVSFLAAWGIGRAVRFFGVAYVAHVLGAHTASRIERGVRVVAVIGACVAIGWFIMSSFHMPAFPR